MRIETNYKNVANRNLIYLNLIIGIVMSVAVYIFLKFTYIGENPGKIIINVVAFIWIITLYYIIKIIHLKEKVKMGILNNSSKGFFLSDNEEVIPSNYIHVSSFSAAGKILLTQYSNNSIISKEFLEENGGCIKYIYLHGKEKRDLILCTAEYYRNIDENEAKLNDKYIEENAEIIK